MKYEWLDAYLLSLPGAEKDYKIEWGWMRYQVRGKLFAAVCAPGAEHKVYGGHELVNLKCDPILIGSLRGEPGIFPAYHMNKDSWLSVALDGSAADDQIRLLLERSYAATLPRPRKRKQP